jgi:probable DNA metabolism protein
MFNLIYDGTFEGLLTAVRQGISMPEMPVTIVAEADFQPDLFSEWQTIITQPETARSFYKKIVQKFSREICLDIGYIYLSETPGNADLLFKYIRELQIHGESIADNFTNPIIFQVQRLREQVNHEMLRLYGFVRFRKMKDNIFYAPIEPVYNVVQFLAPHFKSRFTDQK